MFVHEPPMHSALQATAIDDSEPESPAVDASYLHLKPRNLLGFVYLVLALASTSL